jgi:hypothetical protein
MDIAVCDSEAFLPMGRLVNGPFESLASLAEIERFVRTVVLHDEILMVASPIRPPSCIGRTSGEHRVKELHVVPAVSQPSLAGFDFFANDDLLTIALWNDATKELISLYGRDLDRIGVFDQALNLIEGGRNWPYEDVFVVSTLPTVDFELAPELVRLAIEFANHSAPHIEIHVRFLKRVLRSSVESGGSALLQSDFGRLAVRTARHYPHLLFQHLDTEWQNYAHQIDEAGLGLLVPPVLGIVLSRCARRDAVPRVIRDLRDEWAGARKKVWNLLDALRVCQTLGEALEIRKELADASQLFSSKSTELDSRPVRVLWEIIAAGAAGAGVAALSGGRPAIGAVTGAVTQSARNLPAFTHEFGAMLFGRGAFDLARRVRRAIPQVELDALPRFLSDAERQKLGFR